MFRCFADITAKPVEWLIPGVLPIGEVTLAAGEPKVGKSMNFDLISAKLSRLGERVVMLKSEDDPETVILPRLKKFGANPANIYFGQDAEDMDHLEEFVREVRPRLVIIDVADFFSKKSLSFGLNAMRFVTACARMAKKYRLAIVLIAHLRKTARKGILAILGSIKLPATCRNILLFTQQQPLPGDEEDEEDEEAPDDAVVATITHAACNIGPVQKPEHYQIIMDRADGLPGVRWLSNGNISQFVKNTPTAQPRPTQPTKPTPIAQPVAPKVQRPPLLRIPVVPADDEGPTWPPALQGGVNNPTVVSPGGRDTS